MVNERITSGGRIEAGPAKKPGAQTFRPMSLAEAERQHILAILHDTGGNRTRAAEILGISREGLRSKMQRFGLAETEGDHPEA